MVDGGWEFRRLIDIPDLGEVSLPTQGLASPSPALGTAHPARRAISNDMPHSCFVLLERYWMLVPAAVSDGVKPETG